MSINMTSTTNIGMLTAQPPPKNSSQLIDVFALMRLESYVHDCIHRSERRHSIDRNNELFHSLPSKLAGLCGVVGDLEFAQTAAVSSRLKGMG